MRFRNKLTELTEHKIQSSFVTWCDFMSNSDWRYSLFYAIPNSRKVSLTAMLYFKAEGLKSGVPDLCLPYPSRGYGSLFLEFKTSKGKLTTNQEEWLKKLEKAKNLCYVVRNFETAKQITQDYLK